MSGSLESLPSLTAQATQAANAAGFPANLFLAQIQGESGFQNITSSTPAPNGEYATGIAQFLPSTAANPGYGISAFDPNNTGESLNAAAQYDEALYQQTGSYTGALQAYGTLPSSGSSMTGAQSAIASLASALDTAGNAAASIDNGLIGNPGWLSGNNPTSSQSGLGPFLLEFGTRAALVVIGLVMILGSFYLLGSESRVRALLK